MHSKNYFLKRTTERSFGSEMSFPVLNNTFNSCNISEHKYLISPATNELIRISENT